MATNGEQSGAKTGKPKGSFILLLIALGGALAALCHQGFLPHQVFFSNDTSLGWMMDSSASLPGTFFGKWANLEFLGGTDVASSPSLTVLLEWLVGPEMFMKILVPVSMMVLGVGAWLFFRQLGFAPGVCIVGGLAAGLNMHFFSNACWGLGTWPVAAGMMFVAMAVLVSPSVRPLWVKCAIAGLSIGMVVMLAFDVGAIFSIYTGIFMVFYFLSESPNPVKNMVKTVGSGAVVVLFAMLIAASTIYTLIGSTFTESAKNGTNEDKRQHWIFLTTYSLPKLETLHLIIPGVFGYRLQEFMTDTNKSSAYWGHIAEDYRVNMLESGNIDTRKQGLAELGIQDPQIISIMTGADSPSRQQIMDNIKGHLSRRHTGSGDYVGELVCLLAFFALFNSWRKTNAPYTKLERECIWFWSIAAIISLLASWGRYGYPTYQLIAKLPFISNIRNPIKFLHPMNIALIILAGYGMEALHRCYMSGPARAASIPQIVLRWWKKAVAFDKYWLLGMVAVWVASVIGLYLVSTSKADLTKYLQGEGFSPDLAPQMASFCVWEVFLYIIFFTASAGVMICILSGAMTGGRAILAWIAFAAIMTVDLYHSDVPWVRYFDVKQKYSLNPVTDFLRHEPWEHRVVSARRSPVQPVYDLSSDGNFGALCHFWLENDYMANNIEALEIDQAPRMPELERNYIGLFDHPGSQDVKPTVRLWQLTNTRYILADANLVPAFNQMIEPKNSFRTVMRFDLAMKPGVTTPEDAGDLTAVTNDEGHIALIEYTQALPRLKLYANWQVADDATTLSKLASPEFDPAKLVLVSTNAPVPASTAKPDDDAGTVKFADYHPKHSLIKADAKTPAVLLFNERIGDHWNVWVDDKPASLLRCNYIVRGVFVPRGQHTIEFRYQPPLTFLYVSVSAFAVGVLLVGFVIVSRFRPARESAPAKSATSPDRSK